MAKLGYTVEELIARLDALERQLNHEEDTRLEITLADNTYKHIEDSVKFYDVKTREEYTPLQLMKHNYPETKSLYRRIIAPEQILLLGKTARKKITRAVQYHYTPVTPTHATSLLIPYFEYLSESDNHGGKYETSSDWSASKWACDYNAAQAAAAMVYYGPAIDLQEMGAMVGMSIHRMTLQPDGVFIEIGRWHTLEARIQAACDAAYRYASKVKYGRVADFRSLAMKEFYSYGGTNLSIPADVRDDASAIIFEYIAEIINPLRPAGFHPPLPTYEDPPDEDWVPSQSFLLPYADFTLTNEASTAQRTQRVINNQNAAYAAFYETFADADFGKLYTKAELVALAGGADIDKRITAGVKNGWLQKPINPKTGKPAIGKYYILPPLETNEEN